MRPITALDVAEAKAAEIRLIGSGASLARRAAARAHTDALCRRWMLSLRDEGRRLEGRSVDGMSMTQGQVALSARAFNGNNRATKGKF